MSVVARIRTGSSETSYRALFDSVAQTIQPDNQAYFQTDTCHYFGKHGLVLRHVGVLQYGDSGDMAALV